MTKKIILSLALSTVLFGADVVVKTAGTTAEDNGFTVRDQNSDDLFKVQGDGAVKATKGRISDKGGLVMPVGSLTAFAGSAAPTGWFICDGGEVSRTTYADLFAVIGTTYGSQGSTTFTLPNLSGRNIIGKATSGTFASLNATSGAETHTLTTAQMPSHSHDVNPASFTTGNSTSAGTHDHTVDPAATALSINNATVSRSFTADGTSGDSFMQQGDSQNYLELTDREGTTKTIDMGAHAHSGSVDIASTTSSSTGAHTHTVTVDVPITTSTLVGSGTAHNILDPYIVLNYIIKY